MSSFRRLSSMGRVRISMIALIFLIASAGCAQPASSPTSGQGSRTQGAALKRFTAAIRGNPHTVYQKLNPRSNIPGIDALERMVATGLTVPSQDGSSRVARLADSVVTVDNGLWTLLPDGQMEPRWTIREGAVWQEGPPFTADDLVFTATVVRDKAIPVFGHVAYDSLGDVEALDARTVVAKWTRPYIKADQLFSPDIAVPVAKHK